jgi:hypothetical protein
MESGKVEPNNPTPIAAAEEELFLYFWKDFLKN